MHLTGDLLHERPSRLRAALVSLLACCTAALAACANLDAVDRRIDRVLLERSSDMGARPPRLRAPDVDEATRSDAGVERYPDTVNPPAAELRFDPGDPDRDVLARLASFGRPDGEPLFVGIEDVLQIAQETSREYLNAEEEYIFSVINYLIERHLWTPRFFNDTTFSSDFESIDGRYTTALNIINELRATQRLPYGGEIEARYVTQAAQQLIDIAGDDYTQSSQLILSANIPLLRDAGLIAQEELIQSSRNVVYAARNFARFRRTFLVDVASDYFDLVASLGTIRNQKRQVFNVQQLFRQRQALVEAERLASFESQNVQQSLLSARDQLESLREGYRLALDRFKIRLGLPVTTNLVVVPDALTLPEPDISPEQASRLALTYRLDYQNVIDQVDDQRRGVRNAKNQLLPDLNLAMTAALETDDEPNESSRPNYDLDDTNYGLSVTFGLPLDREIERLNLRASIINLQRAVRDRTLVRDNIILDARASVREIERARNALVLQSLAVEINRRRLEELEIKRDEIDTQDLLDAQADALATENALDNARRDLRVAILEYLLATGQLRVGPEGLLLPPSGMDIRFEREDDDELARPFQPFRGAPGDDAAPEDEDAPEVGVPPATGDPDDDPESIEDLGPVPDPPAEPGFDPVVPRGDPDEADEPGAGA